MFILDSSIKETNFKKLFDFECNLLNKIFKNQNQNESICIVSNNPTNPYPFTGFDNEYLITNVENDSYWCQYIYQVSHELCHHILRCNKTNNEQTTKWFEETLCEAISLVALKMSFDNWNKCELYKIARGYKIHIIKYLNDILNDNDSSAKRTDCLSKCKTLEELELINKTCESCREHRKIERDYLFHLFLDNKEMIHCITEYPEFVCNQGLLINFDEWICKTKTPDFVSKISKIQPCIKL